MTVKDTTGALDKLSCVPCLYAVPCRMNVPVLHMLCLAMYMHAYLRTTFYKEIPVLSVILVRRYI